MFQHAAHTALAAAQRHSHAGSHNGPAQAGTIGHGSIDILYGALALVHHVQGFPPHRILQAIADKPRQLPRHPRYFFPRMLEEPGGPLDDGRVAALPTDHFTEGNQVGWVERMTDHGALRSLAIPLDIAHQ